MEVLLIPGFMLDADLWRDVRADLGSLGRVVDADTTVDDTIPTMAARALEALSGPALVIGFSMGGYIAREMIFQQSAKVRALALVATSSRGALARRVENAGAFRQLGRTAVARSLHPDHRSDDMIGRVQAMSQRLGPDVFFRQSGLARRDDTDRLGEIRCPSLIVAASHDELRTVEESQTLHDGIPGSTMTTINETGHLIPMEQPQALMRAIKAFAAKA